ncbi:MAG TPA: hypothetical protein VG096_24035 [Bryobacteraceae bacterium]|nr:hypothetical protein [Bryobacteraceae bacterium]
MPKPVVPSAVLTAIAHTGVSAASETHARTDMNIPVSTVAVKVPSGLAPPQEQSLEAAASKKPVEEMTTSREDRNRPSKQAAARAWISPQLDSSVCAPADSTAKAVFEPQPSGDPAQTLKPIAGPTGDETHPAPSQTAALEPTTTASPAGAPGSDAEDPQAPPAMKPATPAAASAEAAILAFGARLAALVAPPAAPAQPASATGALRPAQPPEAPPSAKATSVSDPSQVPEPVPSAPVNHGAELPPNPKSAEPEKARTAPDSVSVSAAVHSGPPSSPNITSQAIPTVTAPPDNPPEPPRTVLAAPQGIRTEIESQPEPAKLATPAREIQVQVNRGEQRVDVRLTERNGDVQVAVRTSDSQLAGALREDLPLLSSRLEQAGFRAETWHPGASAPESRLRGVETPSSNSPSQDSDPSRQGGQEQPQAQPRQPKPPAAKAPNSPRKEFEWLMSQVS